MHFFCFIKDFCPNGFHLQCVKLKCDLTPGIYFRQNTVETNLSWKITNVGMIRHNNNGRWGTEWDCGEKFFSAAVFSCPEFSNEDDFPVYRR